MNSSSLNNFCNKQEYEDKLISSVFESKSRKKRSLSKFIQNRLSSNNELSKKSYENDSEYSYNDSISICTKLAVHHDTVCQSTIHDTNTNFYRSNINHYENNSTDENYYKIYKSYSFNNIQLKDKNKKKRSISYSVSKSKEKFTWDSLNCILSNENSSEDETKQSCIHKNENCLCKTKSTPSESSNFNSISINQNSNKSNRYFSWSGIEHYINDFCDSQKYESTNSLCNRKVSCSSNR